MTQKRLPGQAAQDVSQKTPSWPRAFMRLVVVD